MELGNNIIQNNLTSPGPELSEAQFRQLAHLPLLTVFYLLLQRKFSATPVTALELAAYLGIDVRVAEGVLSYLHQQGMVRAFKDDFPAYSLGKELHQITAVDLVALVGEIHRLYRLEGIEVPALEDEVSNDKYRKIYSELASEILQLFGQTTANQLPL